MGWPSHLVHYTAFLALLLHFFYRIASSQFVYGSLQTHKLVNYGVETRRIVEDHFFHLRIVGPEGFLQLVMRTQTQGSGSGFGILGPGHPEKALLVSRHGIQEFKLLQSSLANLAAG